MTSRPEGPLVVIGDALLDIDLDGSATRLTPDAPVPVLDDLVERPRPGGAGLAALMAARDGHDVVLVTAVGDDAAGERLTRLLGDVTLHRLPYDGPTAVKQRVRADGQPMLRLDSGSAGGTVADSAEGLDEALAGAGGVLVSDYGRGVTTVPAVRRLLERLPRQVPVVWDPHGRGGRPVPGVRLATPNRAEAAAFSQQAGAACSADATPLAAVRASAEALVRDWQAQAVAVTLGAGGALLTYGEGMPVVAPAPEVPALDVCGAGDRFAATAALCLASGAVTTEAVHEAVAAAARYVGAGGPASLEQTPPVTRPGERQDAAALVASVAARGGTVVATGGCFDLLHAGHVATLRAARRLGDCLVVCLNSDDSVRRLKGHARPLVPAVDRARVLEALEPVDAVVVFDEDTPVEVLRRLRPDVWAKGGDYAGASVPEMAALEEWGGQAVVLPYLQGRSTSRLVDSAVAGTSTDNDAKESR